jgi:probable HAF family extracellular repeat protein
VNDRGEIVGWSYDDSARDYHAFSYTPSRGMVDLGTLSGSASQATAVNDHGQIVGWSATADGSTDPFSYTRSGRMVDVGGGEAMGVTDSGVIVGWSGGEALVFAP